MSRISIKQGNTALLKILIKDKDGVTVTNLAAATEIKFRVADPDTGIAKFTKTLTAGDIVVNSPTTGYILVTINPTDTEQAVQRYDMACQIWWSAVDTYEVHIYVDDVETKDFTIENDIIYS